MKSTEGSLKEKFQTELPLEGKTIVFSGASGHLGGGMYRHLLSRGATLVNLGRREPTIDSQYAQRSNHVSVDFYDTPALVQALEKVSEEFKPDILVNNSFDFSPATGFNHPSGRIENLSKETFMKGIESGIYWPLVCTQVIGRGMIERRKGNIVNIASMYSFVVADYKMYKGRSIFNPIVYPVAKHGILGLTRYIASFWSEYGIRCNNLSPGAFPKVAAVAAPSTAAAPNQVKDNDFLSVLNNKTSLKRTGRPEDLFSAIEFLCSDKSAYMTGANIVVDGGWTIL